MKRIQSIIASLLLSGLTVHAQDDLFQKAQSSYDDGRYAEAVMLYEKLIQNGVSNPEVQYNLANACFKDSDLPNAVLHYRLAWYDLPRDPDIKANLHFALNAAGAIDPTGGFSEKLFSSLSSKEWILIATTGYLLLCLLLLILLFVKGSRSTLIKLGLIPILMIIIASMGWIYWNQFQTNPEWVVMQTEATALFGPVEGSTAHFKLPIGALVQQRNTDSKGWIEVEYDEKRGWLKIEDITPVSP
jgi:tetratricopeptide (TPR) repeat protein